MVFVEMHLRSTSVAFDHRTLDRLEPRASGPYEVRDDRVKGLFMRVQPSGVKTFYYQLRRAKRLSLGRFPAVTPAIARMKVTRIHEQLARGEEPNPNGRPSGGSRSSITLRQLIKDYSRSFRQLKA